MARTTSDADHGARQRRQALIDDLRAAFNPRIVVDELMENIKKAAEKMHAQADLAERVVNGLQENRGLDELSRQLEADIERNEQLGVSNEDLNALLNAIELDSNGERTLNLVVEDINLRRELEVERQEEIQRRESIERQLAIQRKDEIERQLEIQRQQVIELQREIQRQQGIERQKEIQHRKEIERHDPEIDL